MSADTPQRLVDDMRGVRCGEVLAVYLRDVNGITMRRIAVVDHGPEPTLGPHTAAKVATVLQDEFENSHTLPH